MLENYSFIIHWRTGYYKYPGCTGIPDNSKFWMALGGERKEKSSLSLSKYKV